MLKPQSSMSGRSKFNSIQCDQFKVQCDQFKVQFKVQCRQGSKKFKVQFNSMSKKIRRLRRRGCTESSKRHWATCEKPDLRPVISTSASRAGKRGIRITERREAPRGIFFDPSKTTLIPTKTGGRKRFIAPKKFKVQFKVQSSM